MVGRKMAPTLGRFVRFDGWQRHTSADRRAMIAELRALLSVARAADRLGMGIYEDALGKMHVSTDANGFVVEMRRAISRLSSPPPRRREG